jgi:hypothetical protein
MIRRLSRRQAGSAAGRARIIFALVGVFFLHLCSGSPLKAQGGPPFFINDPGTPGSRNWEINLAYEPFLYDQQSTAHVPDVDINYGLGERIQLTFENAWLRVRDGGTTGSGTGVKYGLGQDQFGAKWRFYENEKSGLEISVFPQASVNNLNHSVRRGITPSGASLLPWNSTKSWGPSISIGSSAITRCILRLTAGSPGC